MSEAPVYQNTWNKKNKVKARAYRLAYRNKLKIVDPLKKTANQAYHGARQRAIKKKIPFDLTREFVLELFRNSPVCPYFGTTLTYDSDFSKMGASLDRIDSSQGYVINNVWVISRLANTMKTNATYDELIAFANGILNQK